MKKLLTLLVVLLSFGCQKNELNYQNLEPITFTATFEESYNTKTSFDSVGNVFWKKGDQVSVFAGNTVNHQFQVSDASEGKTFAILTQVSNPGFVAGTDISNNVAFYHYYSSASIVKHENSYILSDITLPSIQNYADGSLGNGTFPMIAVTNSTSDMALKFMNILGGVKLQLKGTASIASIKITGNNNEILCGAMTITASLGSTPSISLTDVSAKTVTLDCADGVQLNSTAATSFVIALPPADMPKGFTIAVTDTNGKSMTFLTEKSQTITRSCLLQIAEKTYTPDLPQAHKSVDLGLPSKTLWATTNVGASKPSDYGDYFAWAETSAKETYEWSNLKYHISGDSYDNVIFSKYVATSKYGTVDNKTILEPEDDAATANWGKDWRTPTHEEWQELFNSNYCTWEWTTLDNRNGYKVTSKSNGNNIFLPAAGYRIGFSLKVVDSYGIYWSSSLNVLHSTYGWGCSFGSSGMNPSCNFSRYYGQSVRPVASSSQN